MVESLQERLTHVLPDLPAEDVHAVAAFAEFLAGRRRNAAGNGERKLSDQEHAQMLAALNAVAELSLEEGPAVSNCDHDRYLYGAT
jgi:hypothetical protein